MKREGDYLILSSGRRLYANGGILGMSENGAGRLEVTEGYDGVLDMPDYNDYTTSLSLAEQLEVAEYAIGLWRQYAENAKARADA